MQKTKTLFLALQVFSATGGIEKVCKVAGKALFELAKASGSSFSIYSMHDGQKDFKDNYFDRKVFRGFNATKLRFCFRSVIEGCKSDVVFLSHINLLVVGFLIKLMSPTTQMVLFAHGIEVWKKLPWWKQKMLRAFNCVLSVSSFTNRKMVDLQQLNEGKCVVLNNCLDPFLREYPSHQKDEKLLNRYSLSEDDIVLLTLSRISSHDRDKGYEKVLMALKELLPQFPKMKYLVVGKYQQAEKQWLDGLINENGLSNAVIFTGYVSDAELAAHINLADVYVMPSKKEGFGIIFIEAMFYGKPVVAGNKDGSPDVLAGNSAGILVDPDNVEQITEAIKMIITNQARFVPSRQMLMSKFGFDIYKQNLGKIVEGLIEAQAA